jgi:CHASE2 domain-containing sensor protein/signal transduction histidine kinase
VAALSTAVVAGLAVGRTTARADNLIYDALSKLSVRTPHDDIVIVAIDNRSIETLGRWPWPRAEHTALLRRLAQARPRAVAYDVLFVEPDRDPAADAALAGAIRSAAPVFLPLTFDVPGDNGALSRTVLPTDRLRAAAAGLGQVNVAFDPDGVVRRVFLAEGNQDHPWPHLMELMFRAAQGRASEPYVRQTGPTDIRRRPDALVRSKPLLIAFAGPPGQFRTISFVDVLRGETPPEFLRGKLVLVGSTADGLGDRYATPLSGGTEAMSGVELQANLLDTLVTHRAIRPAGRGAVAGFSVALLWLLLAGLLWLRPRTNMILGAVLAIAPLAASALLLIYGRIWAPPVTALAGLALVYPLWSWRRLEASSAYMVEELRQFAQEPDLLPSLNTTGSGPPSDVIARQMELMRHAVGRARDLRSFVTNALQGLPDATLLTDLDGAVLLANREADLVFERLTGQAPTGRTLTELTAAWIRERPTEDEARSAELDGAVAEEADIEMTTTDGQTHSVRRTALKDAQDETVGWIIRFTDITALKAASRQREHILQLLTHDMRSPQVSILALISGAADGAVQPKLGQRIEGYARRTLALADNFVHLARAETHNYAMEVVNLVDVLVEAVDGLWPQSTAKEIVVTTQGCDDEYLVHADRSLLTRALINLVDNAIKYTDPGGRVDCRLWAAPSPAGPSVICTIADNGRGMSADQLSHLFEQFRRAPSDGKAHIDGVGLGLAFVQTVVQRHGGVITCESKPMEGAVFTVTLPLSDGDAPRS